MSASDLNFPIGDFDRAFARRKAKAELVVPEWLKQEEKVLVPVRVNKALRKDLAMPDSNINKIELSGKNWFPARESKYLKNAMESKHGSELNFDELIDKLTTSFEKVLNPRDLKLLESLSYKNLNDLIENNIVLNREMVIVNEVDSNIWQDLKDTVKDFATHETVNNLEKYSDMPKVDIFKTELISNLAPLMLQDLNKENSDYSLLDIQKFFTVLNKTLAANLDDSSLDFLSKEASPEDIFLSLNSQTRQKDIQRILFNNGEDSKIFKALVSVIDTKLSEGEENLKLQSPESSNILEKIDSAPVREVLEILIPDLEKLKSIDSLNEALANIEIFDLNRTLMNKGVDKDDFHESLSKLNSPALVSV